MPEAYRQKSNIPCDSKPKIQPSPRRREAHRMGSLACRLCLKVRHILSASLRWSFSPSRHYGFTSSTEAVGVPGHVYDHPHPTKLADKVCHKDHSPTQRYSTYWGETRNIGGLQSRSAVDRGQPKARQAILDHLGLDISRPIATTLI
jgi:hypothetical protein